jgi:hypothetical protein
MRFLISFSIQYDGALPTFGNIDLTVPQDGLSPSSLSLSDIRGVEQVVRDRNGGSGTVVVLYVTPLAEEG